MLRFFRTLRQSLLAENRAGKYLLYAVGEIVLVVIGILIALQINNWNEERIDNIRLKNHLNVLQNSLKEDVDNLQTLVRINRFRSGSMNYLLKSRGEPTSFLDSDVGMSPTELLELLPPRYVDDDPTNDSLQLSLLAFEWSDRPNFVQINRDAIEELKNTGVFSMIRDTVLKKSITKYYSRAAWHFNEIKESSTQKELEQWYNHIIDRHQILLEDVGKRKDPDDILKDNLTRLYLREIAFGAGYRAAVGQELIDKAQALTELIDIHLNDMDKN